jgi:hypothetical protein
MIIPGGLSEDQLETSELDRPRHDFGEANEPASSAASNRECFGLSMSSTPSSSPSGSAARRFRCSTRCRRRCGREGVHVLDQLHLAVCAATPHTPVAKAMRMQAGRP